MTVPLPDKKAAPEQGRRRGGKMKEMGGDKKRQRGGETPAAARA